MKQEFHALLFEQAEALRAVVREPLTIKRDPTEVFRGQSCPLAREFDIDIEFDHVEGRVNRRPIGAAYRQIALPFVAPAEQVEPAALRR